MTIGFKSIFSKQQRIINRLSRLPRYSEGTFECGKLRIAFPDSKSFVFTYKEIFIGGIYKFNSKNKSPVIIDCGANIGMSVIYFKKIFPDSRIIAFEPERKIFEYLQKNVKTQNLRNVELIEKAVWKEEGHLMFLNEGADASRLSSLGDIAQRKSSYKVEAVQLSKFINQEIDFLKLDIEGAESEVIKEIEGKLHYIRNIFIEYHSPEKGVQELGTILNILSRNKFRYYIDSSFRMRNSPFVDRQSYMSFDFFLNIFAEKLD